MGYTVLYIAFGMVALWLLGEVLLQYKARLRWRLLAFAGFTGVVTGVYLRDIVVIALGAAAFGTGQAFVTLSYRRGFSTGWALGGRPGSSRRRRGLVDDDAGEVPPAAEPTLEVSSVEEVASGARGAGAGRETEAESTQIYQPLPLYEDSGEFPVYNGESGHGPGAYADGGHEGYGTPGYTGWGGEQQSQPAAASYDAASYQGAASYEGYDQSAAPAWSDTQGYDTQGYGGQGYDAPYATPPQEAADASYGYGQETQGGYGQETPSGGVWVPQQSNAGQQPPYGEEQQPYIPPQPRQQPYDQSQYADPYDPYRY